MRFTMHSLRREIGRSLTPDTRRRLLFATAASAATGGIIHVLVMHLLLPVVQAHLGPAHIKWLREAFADHPLVVLSVVGAFAALLAAPVLGVFRWVYGPMIR